jgi:hypothetical protein
MKQWYTTCISVQFTVDYYLCCCFISLCLVLIDVLCYCYVSVDLDPHINSLIIQATITMGSSVSPPVESCVSEKNLPTLLSCCCGTILLHK